MEEDKVLVIPDLQIYTLYPAQVERFESLLTEEAVSLIRQQKGYALLAVEGNEACGAICGSIEEYNDEVLEIISIYVIPEKRRQGVASTLVQELMDVLQEDSYGELKHCRCYFKDDLDGMRDFWKYMNFSVEKDDVAASYLLPMRELADAPLMQYTSELPARYEMTSLDKTSPMMIKRLFQNLNENGIDDMTETEAENSCRDAGFIVTDKEEPIACAFFTENDKKSVCLSQFYLGNGSTSVAICMLQQAVRKLMEQYSEDTFLEIPVLTESSARMAKKLLGSECKQSFLLCAFCDI